MKGRRPRHPDREKAAYLRWKGLLLGARACVRCGGLLMRDEEPSFSIDREMSLLHCIQCGEWIDELILWNRVTSNGQGKRNRQRSVRM
jgi:hypothetical protein